MVPSSSVPADDPTPPFTNAGEPVQGYLPCREERDHTGDFTRSVCMLAQAQRLENVGYTARHHTFFEMLGNSVW
ncbi:alanine--tRNA ligase-related protein [Marinobacter sp.]|uniref:alanine--tRNA ligase-related protein n=1 Tax=Marinobacter sp. TaxID=50741 RepID=UPI003A8E09AD